MRIYVDTNVYVDLFEGRKEKFKDWDEFAAQLFRKVKNKEYTLVISDWLFEEVKKVMGSDEQLCVLLNDITKEHKILVETTLADKRKARALSKDNFPDALHVVLARKGKAIYLVTRDTKDFEKIGTIKISLPQSL